MPNNEPIRVLCVFSCLDRGGAESMCMNLYRHIDRSKVQFDFVKHTPNKGAFEDEIVSLGGRIFEAPQYKIYNHFSYVSWWKKHLSKQPEHTIVHGHYFTISAVYLSVCNRFNRITIAHSHNTHLAGSGFSLLTKKALIKLIPVVSKYCFACSNDAGLWLFPHRRFKILNNAIDAKQFRFDKTKREHIRNNLGIDKEFVIGHIGCFSEQKNHRFIIEIFKEIKQIQPDSKLVLIGDGELRHSIEKKVKSYGLTDSVIFTGVRNDIPDLLQAIDVFLFPSLYEGLPVTVVEAQAAGLKCFLSEAVTKEADLTGRCEFLPIDNPKKWSDRILSDDLTRIDTYSQITEANYDIHTTARKLEKFYLRISK